MSPKTALFRTLCAALTALAIAACAPAGTLQVPAPLQPASPDALAAPEAPADTGTAANATQREARTPALPVPTTGYTVGSEAPAPMLQGDPLTIVVEDMGLPEFINEVYGRLLGLDFSLDPSLARKRDRVTLRVTEPQAPNELYRIATEVLAQYGVKIERSAGVMNFAPSKTSSVDKPLLVSGRALPDVPVEQRPVFQLVQLRAVYAGDVSNWLQAVYEAYGLEIRTDIKRNALMLSGKASVVRDAVEALELLDRPFMRGRNGLRFSPAFLKADELAEQLINVLRAEGYAASRELAGAGAIVVLPITSANIVLLFAADEGVLRHARDWAVELDVPPSGSGQSFFIYEVRNTRADSIAATVNALFGQTEAIAMDAEAGDRQRSERLSRALVVDEGRNALIFQGEAARWQEISAIIRELDRPPKQVLIEITVAEVTLSGQESFGVEWFDAIDGNPLRFAPASEGVGGVGLTYSVLDSAGAAKAVLNAFASDSRVNILSTPRVLVQSGGTATVDVGTEVPIITSQSEGTDTTARLTQEVQYRKTGLILSVSPVVHSGNRVDMEVSQEISEALPLSADSAVSSPSIFTRAVETTLSLDDGGSVLLAGLLTSRETKSDGGVPLLKDIPLLGAAFRTQSQTSEKTELVIMIMPYVIENGAESRAITDSIMESFRWIE